MLNGSDLPSRGIGEDRFVFTANSGMGRRFMYQHRHSYGVLWSVQKGLHTIVKIVQLDFYHVAENHIYL